MSAIQWAERGLLPDALIRLGIRRLCRRRLRDEGARAPDRRRQRYRALLHELRSSPVAIETDAANEQHYELPPAFFEQVLGRHLKYSSCLFEDAAASLDDAEAAMLAVSCRRAGLADDQDILELGCGWGSLTLWMARHYPASRITAVSNSAPQRRYIEKRAAERELDNVRVITADVNRFTIDSQFDRVVSVEMFEHMRNYQRLMAAIAGWLRPGGKLFVHIFCHRSIMYPFETEGEDNWMGRHFFTGGLMPAADTLLQFQDDLAFERQWQVPGTHYQRTAECWLENMDENREAILPVLADTYGADQAALWFQRWRMFFMACAELFGYRDGSEWLVGHYRFARTR